MKTVCYALLLSILFGCGGQRPDFVVGEFDRNKLPEKLSDWGMLATYEGTLLINPRSLPYDLNTPLFSDYARKLRTIWLPPGTHATYDAKQDIQLPTGTVISKTFYYTRNGGELVKTRADQAAIEYSPGGLDLNKISLVETRLLVKKADGWLGIPYVWNEAQTEATLEIAGDTRQINLSGQTFIYVVPDSNQCQGCHVEDLSSREMKPLGIKVRHLNKAYGQFHQPANQLAYMKSSGWITGLPDPVSLPVNADWQADGLSLEHRARSYLDVNCSHCHNPAGAADTSALFLTMEEARPIHLGICKPPVAAGKGTGGLRFSIEPGNASGSILSYRMKSLVPGSMMPELGRSINHSEGIELIDNWINSLSGNC